jgi:hypothetical protein
MKEQRIFDTSNRGHRGEIISTHRMPKPRFPFIPTFALLLGIGAIAVALLMGCAGNMSYRDTFMNRAQTFDKAYEGQELSDEYMECYSVYFSHIIDKCVPMLVEEESPSDPAQNPYWYCCDDALDAMEDCVEEEK